MRKGCLFDLDGTLVNSLTDLALSTNEVLRNHQLPQHDISKYNHFVGNGIQKLMERALGQEHLDILDECLREFQVVYARRYLDHTQPYEGIMELIETLYDQGIKLSVVTNKPHDMAIQIVEHLFPNRFVSILGQQDAYPIKPNPESVHFALMAMKLRRQDCYFIGDSDVDIETGYRADMKTIGVSWGFRGRLELEEAGADYVVDEAMEIWRIINENWGE